MKSNRTNYLTPVKKVILLTASLLFGLLLINNNQRVSANTLPDKSTPAITTPFESKLPPVKIIQTNELLKEGYVDLRSKRQSETDHVLSTTNN